MTAETCARDTALADFLLSAWRELHSVSRQPPRCPRCASGKTACVGIDAKGLPHFACNDCNRHFNRMTGSPMARLRPEVKLQQFFQIAGSPLSVKEGARWLGIRADTLTHWSTQTRLWLLALDPEGSWERRVQLGVRYACVVDAELATASQPAIHEDCNCTLPEEGAARPADDFGPRLVRVCPHCDQQIRAQGISRKQP